MFKRIGKSARKALTGGLAALMLVSSLGLNASAVGEVVTTPEGTTPGARAETLAKMLMKSEESYVKDSGKLTYADEKQFAVFSNATLGSTTTNPAATMPEGIVLSTGDAKQAFGDKRPLGGNFGGRQNDADMAKLINGVQQYDTVALEFDVKTEGNVLAFDWMFASNEFDQGKQYYDTLGIFVDGKNIATMLDSKANIDVKNLKDGEEPVLVEGNDYYVSDMAFSDSAYIGHTPMRTSMAYVTPGSTVHVKIALCDLSDDAFDSAVFLRAKSIETRSAVQLEKAQSTRTRGEDHKFVKEPCNVAGGQDITYQLTATNTSGIEATNVIVSDKVPEGMTLKAMHDGGYHDAGKNEVKWELGNMAVGEVRTVSFTCTVPTTAGVGIWHNTGHVESANGSVMDSNTVTAIKDGAPNVILSKAQAVNRGVASTETQVVGPNDEITYSISIYNNGKGSARDVTVYDTIPEGLELVSTSISGEGTWDEKCIAWHIGELKAGDVYNMTYVCKAGETMEPKEWLNTATAMFLTSNSTEEQTVYSNTVVIEKDGQAMLVLGAEQKVNDRAFTSDEVTVVAGNEITYKITVKNALKGTATDVEVINPLPQGLEYVQGSASGEGYLSQGNLIWRLPDIKGEESVELTFKCKVGSTTTLNKYAESAVANYSHANISDSVSSTSNVVNAIKDGMPILTIKSAQSVNGGERTQSQRSVEAGDKVEYFVTVLNEGQGTAKKVKLTTKIPDGMEYTKGSISDDGIEQSHILTWELGDIEPGKSITVTYQASVPSTGEHQSYESIAEATFGHTNDSAVNQVSGNTLTLNKDGVSTMILDMSQTAGNDLTNQTIVVKEGNSIRYRLTLTNTGNGTAKDVHMVAMVPGETTLDIRQLDSSADYLLRKSAGETPDFMGLVRLFSLNDKTEYEADGFVSWAFDRIAPGAQVTKEFTVTLPRGSAKSEFYTRAVATYGTSNDPDDVVGKSNDVIAKLTTASTITVQMAQSLNGGDFTAGNLTSVKKDDTITYKIVVRNTGDAPVSDVVVTDRVPSTLLIDAKSITENGVLENNEVKWNLRSMDAGEAREFSFTVTIPGTNGSMSWTNTVAVTGSNMNAANSNSLVASTSGTVTKPDDNNNGNTNNGGNANNGGNSNNNGGSNQGSSNQGNNNNGTGVGTGTKPNGSSSGNNYTIGGTQSGNKTNTSTSTSNKAQQAAQDNAQLANKKKNANPQTGVEDSSMALNVVLGIMGFVALAAGGVLIYMKKTGKNPFKRDVYKDLD